MMLCDEPKVATRRAMKFLPFASGPFANSLGRRRSSPDAPIDAVYRPTLGRGYHPVKPSGHAPGRA